MHCIAIQCTALDYELSGHIDTSAEVSYGHLGTEEDFGTGQNWTKLWQSWRLYLRDYVN